MQYKLKLRKMKTDEKGCSTCPIGQEQWEAIKLPSNRKINGVQYDYRDEDGNLFSCIGINLAAARFKRDYWLLEKLVNKYKADPSCNAELWIADAKISDELKEKFVEIVTR